MMLNYNECLIELRKKVKKIEKDGLSIVIKPVPETEKDGALDPRQVLWSEKCRKTASLSIRDSRHATIDEIYSVRKSMGCKNQDLSKNITVKEAVLDRVNVEIYQAKDLPPNSPVAVYIHGGGFIGGTVGVTRNICKLLAERSGSTVVSIDYSLAPENRFPVGLNECYRVIEYIFQHHETLEIDSSRLIVMGDSAGANLAAACCLMDRQRRIRLQVLLYPLTDINPDQPEWTENDYVIREDPELAKYMIYDLKDLINVSAFSYVNSENDFRNPLASPFWSEDPSEFPTTLIVSPEYDYLKSQAENFACQLSENGVDVVLYRYRGMAHAFFEHPGEFPQAEDCVNEIAAAIMAL